MHTHTKSKPHLTDHDPVLGPITANHSGSTATNTLLALLAGASVNQIPVPVLRLWINSRLAKRRPDVVSLSKSSAWNTLVTASSRYMAQSRNGSSLLPPRFARRALARVLSENSGDAKVSTVSGHKMIQARHTAAVIGLEAIRYAHTGKESVIVSDPWLVVRRGIDRGTARRQRQLLIDLGWLHLVAGGRAGYPSRVKLTRLPGSVGELVGSESMYATIGRIASQEDDGSDVLSALFGSAAHPAWAYSPVLGSAHWLVAVADAAGVDPVPLGVAARRLSSLRKDLMELFGVESAGRDAKMIVAALDSHAIEVGAFGAYDAAEEARRSAAEERKAAVLTVRAEKKAAAEEKAAGRKVRDTKKAAAETAAEANAVPAVNAPVETIEQQGIRLAGIMTDRVGSLPLPEAGGVALQQWLTAAEPFLRVCAPTLRMVIANSLYTGLLEAGWEQHLAARFGQECAGSQDQDLAA